MEKEVREVIVERKVGFSTKEVIIIMLATLIFGALVGSFVNFKRNNKTTKTSSSELSEFLITYKYLTNDYYEKVDGKKLSDAAIKGMIEYLDDPYTVYLENKESEVFSQTVDGEYYGVGAVITKQDNKVIIASILKNSPAEKAQLKPGDQIIKIDDKDITEQMSVSEVTDLIKSKENNTAVLKIIRDGKEQIVKIDKSKVDIPSVVSDVIEKNNKKVGYIGISVFASNTYRQLVDELKKLEEDSIDSIIIDVRSNPGGHLSQVAKILSLFVDKGDVLYQIKSNGKQSKVYSTNKNSKEYKIVVLVNEDSASASELLTATLKEVTNATVIGNKTYGKGTVQKAYSLSSGAIVKYTSEEWLTPNGNSINKSGITPDIEVKLDDNYYKDPSKENDNQLQRALNEITK